MPVPVLQFKPAEPVNLMDVLEAQARCLIENKVPKEVGVAKDKFLDDAMSLAGKFAFSIELAAIRLDRVWMVHHGVRDRFLCEAGGVNMYTDIDKFTMFGGVTMPEGLSVLQGQLGLKYKNVSPRAVRYSYDPLEQLGIPKVGLTAFLYWGDDLLRESDMDFPGAVSVSMGVPYLRLGVEAPVLGGRNAGGAGPSFGSVSVSRGN